MRNNVLNVTGTGGWQDTITGNNIASIFMQVRTSTTMDYRFKDQTNFMTIKADESKTIYGKFDPGDLLVRAANGVVMEIELSTVGRLTR